MVKGLCAVAAALTMSCVASADAGETFPDHQYFAGTDPWTTPDFHLPKKREWPDGPNKEFLKSLQRPDNYKNPHRDTILSPAATQATPSKPNSRSSPATSSIRKIAGMPGSKTHGCRCRRTRSSPTMRQMAKRICSCLQTRSSASCGRRGGCDAAG